MATGFSSNPGMGMSNPYGGFKPLGALEGGGSGLSTQGQTQTQAQSQTQEATKATQNQTYGQNTQSFGTENTQVNIDNMDPATRQAYNQFITQLQGGGNSAMQQQQQAFLQTIQALQGNLQNFSPEAATAMAQGNVQGLTRQLMEQIMPQITGAQEAAGLSGDALTALLSQDAAARTAEAQQRAILEAMMGFGQLNNQAAQALIQGTSQMDPLTAAMMGALQIGKGSVQQGYTNTQKAMNESTQGFSNQVTEALKNVMQQGNQMQTQLGQNNNGALVAALAAGMLPPGVSLASAGVSEPLAFMQNGQTRGGMASNAINIAAALLG